MSKGHIGLEAAPSDDELEDWLGNKLDTANEEMEETIQDFAEIVKMGMDDGEPYLWSYARLLNYLATLDNPTMIRILSASLWTIMEAEVTA